MARNHEVTEKHLLLDAQGELVEPGWSRRPVQVYERKMIKGDYFYLPYAAENKFTLKSDNATFVECLPSKQ